MKRSRNKMRRNDPHSVHVSENRERWTPRPRRLLRGNEGEAETYITRERKIIPPLSSLLSFSVSLSFTFFGRFSLHHCCLYKVTAIGVCRNARAFLISFTIVFDFLLKIKDKNLRKVQFFLNFYRWFHLFVSKTPRSIICSMKAFRIDLLFHAHPFSLISCQTIATENGALRTGNYHA